MASEWDQFPLVQAAPSAPPMSEDPWAMFPIVQPAPSEDWSAFPEYVPPEGIDPSTAPAQGMGYMPENKRFKDYARTTFDQGMQGATFGFADEVTDRIGSAIAAFATGQKYKDVLKEARSTTQDRLSEQMREMPVTSVLANLGGGLVTGAAGRATALGKGAISSLGQGPALARIGKGALAGAASGGLYGAGVASDEKKREGAIKGAALGGALGGAIPAAGAVVIPKLDEATREIGNLAQKYNIPISLSELSNGRVRKTIQKVSQEIPLSGQEAFREKQLSRWAQEVLKTTGEDASDFTPKVMDRAFTRVGKEFDSFTKGKTFQIDSRFKMALDDIAEEATTLHTGDAIGNFRAMVEKVMKEFQPNGEISGEKLALLRAKVNEAARKTTVAGADELFHDLENKIIDLITENAPEAAERLSRAKHQYKNLIVIEPLVKNAQKGQISPTRLAERVSRVYGRQYIRGKAGPIGDLARIGRELLPVPGGSDTAFKLPPVEIAKEVVKRVSPGGTAVAVGYFNPAATVGVLAGNRAYQSLINRNPALVSLALKGARK